MQGTNLTPWSDNKADQMDVMEQMARMSALPSRSFRTSQEEFFAAQQSYLDVLIGVDLAILHNVVSNFIAGEYLDDHEKEQWFPSPAAIKVQCRRLVKKLSEDRARNRLARQSIEEANKKIIRTEEEKERARKLWENAKKENDYQENSNSPEAAKRRLEALADENGEATKWDEIQDNDGTGTFSRLGVGLNALKY